MMLKWTFTPTSQLLLKSRTERTQFQIRAIQDLRLNIKVTAITKTVAMANEHLLKKWRLWFQCMDKQRKGQLSKEDQKQEEESFVKMSNLGEDRKRQVVESSKKLWNEFVFHGKDGPVSEEEFIAMTNESFQKDKRKFEESIRSGCNADLRALDQNNKGLLTEEVFLNAYKAGGFHNDEWNKKFFQDLNPVDGKVPFDNLTNAWVQFLVSEDSSKKDVIMEILELYHNA